MDQIENKSVQSGQLDKAKGLVSLFVCFGVLFFLYFVLGWFDNATELVPSQEKVELAVFCIGGVTGVVTGAAAIYVSKSWEDWRRIGFAVSFMLVGFLLGFLVSSRAADIVEGLIDFPPSRTRSYTGLLLISRAYQTHGKGGNYNIQTTPIWSNLDITEDDYKFMLAHRRPGDESRDPDEIASKGYFCAKVTIQQSGDSLRVMNAGSHALSKGTVIICPQPVHQ